jgi:hypothetical protein
VCVNGDEGDDGWSMAQHRSHGRFHGYEDARASAVGLAGGGVSIAALHKGFLSVGVKDNEVMIFSELS